MDVDALLPMHAVLEDVNQGIIPYFTNASPISTLSRFTKSNQKKLNNIYAVLAKKIHPGKT